jgi:hypothetical protein
VKANKLAHHIFLAALGSFAAQYAVAAESVTAGEVAPDSIDSFVRDFDKRELERKELERAKLRDRWVKIQEQERTVKNQSAAAELESLKKSAREYERSIESAGKNRSEPYALFNLARVHYTIGRRVVALEQGSGEANFLKSMDLSKLLINTFPDFEKNDQAGYIGALSAEALKQDDAAKKFWQLVGSMKTKSIFVAHAHIALGDERFGDEDPVTALKHYQKALEGLPSTESSRIDYERVRAKYRLSWAAFKAAQLDLAVSTAKDLLQPALATFSLSQRRKITQDAVELVAHALYEQNEFTQIKAELLDKRMHEHAATAGLIIMEKYVANGLHAEANDVGQLVLTHFRLTSELPAILDLVASSCEKIGKTPTRISALEKIAMLLPKDSLWRGQFGNDRMRLRSMEQRAEAAARIVAAHHYDQGLATGSRNSYASAAAFFTILTDFKPNSEDANRWRLKIAHSAYFTNEYKKADAQYDAIRSQQKVDNETLEVAAYQLAMSRERAWRAAYANAVHEGKDPANEAEVNDSLRSLEAAVDDFSNKFPDKARSVDLLLVAAACNRDNNKLAQASKYWQRAMVSAPTHSQRASAIRGILFASVKEGNYSEAVKLSEQFLQLEDWGTLGSPLRTEVLGVLSSAANSESQKLSDLGKVRDAGTLLTRVALDYKEIPAREDHLRNGSYLLAVAGDWTQTRQAAGYYIENGLQKHSADMNYLMARALEHQFEFKAAATQFLLTAKKFPEHKRSVTCLKKAEALAVGEDDYTTAGHAALILGDRSKEQSLRIGNYARAGEHYLQANEPEFALKAASRRLATSKAPSDKIAAEIQSATIRYDSGDEVKALQDYQTIASRIERSKGSLGDSYPQLAALANSKLAEEDLAQLEDFDINTRDTPVQTSINTKAKYFEAMAKRFDTVARLDVPGYSSKARFEIANAAELLSQDILTAQNKYTDQMNNKSRSDLSATSEKLRRMAQRYYSENVLARNRNPGAHRNDPYIKKSTLRLSAFQKTEAKPEFEEEMESAVRLDVPQSWSL